MSIVVSTRNKAGLVGELHWRRLTSSGGKRKAEILAAVRELGARRIVVCSGTGESMPALGLYTTGVELDLHDDEGPRQAAPKRLYSLAAAFARFVGGANAVLQHHLVDGRVLFVVVEGGRPTSEHIASVDEATAAAQRMAGGADGVSYDRWSNNPDLLGGELVGEEDLWGHTPQTALVSPPINLVAWVGGALVIALGIGGWVAYEQFIQEKKRQELKRKQREADPRPRYQAALTAALPELGADREQFVAAIKALGSRRVMVQGWILEEIACSLRTKECRWQWKREVGTTSALAAALATDGLVLREQPSIDVARFASPLELAWHGVTERSALTPVADAERQLIEVAQRWTNAELSAPSITALQVWPKVPGIDPRKLPADMLVHARQVSVAGPLGLAGELVRSASADVWWSEFRIQVASGGTDATINLVGSSYVQ